MGKVSWGKVVGATLIILCIVLVVGAIVIEERSEPDEIDWLLRAFIVIAIPFFGYCFWDSFQRAIILHQRSDWRTAVGLFVLAAITTAAFLEVISWVG